MVNMKSQTQNHESNFSYLWCRPLTCNKRELNLKVMQWFPHIRPWYPKMCFIKICVFLCTGVIGPKLAPHLIKKLQNFMFLWDNGVRSFLQILLVWRNHWRAEDHNKHLSKMRSNHLTPCESLNLLLVEVPIIMLIRNKQWNNYLLLHLT